MTTAGSSWDPSRFTPPPQPESAGAPAYGPPPTYSPPPPYGHPGAGYPHPPAASYAAPGYRYPMPPMQKPTGWFIVNWLFFWPLAIYSLVSAWQNIDPAYYAGNVAEAQRQAGRVRKFGIISLGIAVGFVILYIIAVVALFAAVTTTGGP